MEKYRKISVMVGVLYIIGTVSGILSAVIPGTMLSGENFLVNIAANPLQLRISAFFVLTMGLSLAIMPVFLYPLFKRQNEALALGIVVFRGSIEGVLYLLFVINFLLLTLVSQEFIHSSSGEFLTIGTTLKHVQDVISPVLTIVFIFGAVLIYSLFYSTQLIPRWLSLWGLAGTVFYLFVDLGKFFNLGFNIEVMYAPLGIQEMVMAVWLIVKGFNTTAVQKLVGE